MIRWGIIGCGNVTEVKSGPGFQLADDSRLVAVMRRTPGLAEDYARRHNVPKWYDRAEDLIEDPAVDAVYVATPPGSHMELALAVCRARKPCYVEKPMARSFEECARMVETFATAELGLFVAYYRRGLPRFRKAREILDAGRLGRVTGVSYRYCSPGHRKTDTENLPWRLRAPAAGGGFFMDLGSHTLDILDFMLGPIEHVTGQAANLAGYCEVEDAVAMQFRLESGALGTASWNFAADVSEDVIEIAGTEGRLTLSTFGVEPVQLETSAGVEHFDLANPPHVQQPLIQTVVDDLLGRGRCPSTGASAERTAKVMDTVLATYYGPRTGDFYNHPDTWPGHPSRRSSP